MSNAIPILFLHEFSNADQYYWGEGMSTETFGELVTNSGLCDVLAKKAYKAVVVANAKGRYNYFNIRARVDDQLYGQKLRDLGVKEPQEIFVIAINSIDTDKSWTNTQDYTTHWGILSSNRGSNFKLRKQGNFWGVTTPEGYTIADMQVSHGVVIHSDIKVSEDANTKRIAHKILKEVAFKLSLSGEELREAQKKAEEEQAQRDIKEYVSKMADAEVDTLKSKVNTHMSYIDDYKARLAVEIQNYELASRKLKLLEQSTVASSNELYKEIMNINNMYKVKKVEVDIERTGQEKLIIYTDDMYVTLPEDFEEPPILIGQFKIVLDLKHGSVRLLNLTNTRRGFWTGHDNHPHVDGEGVPCLGSIAQSVSELMGQFELCALYSVLASYLESVNLDDAAGEYIWSWGDDPEALRRKLDKGEYVECHNCGYEIPIEDAIEFNGEYFCGDDCMDEYKSENGNYCEECGDWVENGNEIYDEVSGEFFCCPECADSYRERNYVVCAQCGEYFRDGDGVFDEEANEYFCSSDCALEYKDSGGYWCEECGAWVQADDSIEYNGVYFCCDDCMDEYKERNEHNDDDEAEEEMQAILQEEQARREEL